MKTILQIMLGALLSIILYGELIAQDGYSPNGEFYFTYVQGKNQVVTSLNDTIDIGPNFVAISDEGHIYFELGYSPNKIPVYISSPFLIDDLHTDYVFVQYDGPVLVQLLRVGKDTITYKSMNKLVEGFRHDNSWLELWQEN